MKKGVGVIGLGYAGGQHLDAYIENPDTEVKMVCSLPQDGIPERARDLGIKHTADWQEVIKNDDVEIVSICTPDYQHGEQAVAAVNAGKHVFCEKPLATTVDDCQRVVDAVAKKSVKFLTGQVLRFAPLFRSLKKVFDSGKVGKPVFAESDYLHDCRALMGGWRIDPAHSPDLILGGGCHPIDLLRWIMGDVEQVYAQANKMCMPDLPMPADNALLSLKFENGAIGKVQVTIGCPRPYALNLSIYGDKGTLVNNKLFSEDFDELEDFIDLPLPMKAEYQYYNLEIEELVAAIKEDRETSVTALDGAKTIAVCLAAIESAQKDAPVKVATF